MRLTVIGCSGTMPDEEGPASAYLVEADGYRLLVDCGNGASGPVQRYAGLTGLDAVLISHIHSDHCIDLGVFSYARPLLARPHHDPAGVRAGRTRGAAQRRRHQASQRFSRRVRLPDLAVGGSTSAPSRSTWPT